jgi:hypothetical protein
LILSGDTAITEWILLELMTSLTKSEHPDTLLQWFVFSLERKAAVLQWLRPLRVSHRVWR